MGDITWPAISKGQLIIALQWLITQLVTMQVVDANDAQRYIQLGSTLITAAWLIGDGVVRKGRNEVLAAHVAKTAPGANLPKSTLVG